MTSENISDLEKQLALSRAILAVSKEQLAISQEQLAIAKQHIAICEKYDKTTLGRSIAISLTLAERAALAPEEAIKPSPVDDRLLSPNEAARYLGISWPTLRDSWVKQYGIKRLGEGRSQRFRLSELQRVIRQREAEARR